MLHPKLSLSDNAGTHKSSKIWLMLYWTYGFGMAWASRMSQENPGKMFCFSSAKASWLTTTLLAKARKIASAMAGPWQWLSSRWTVGNERTWRLGESNQIHRFRFLLANSSRTELCSTLVPDSWPYNVQCPSDLSSLGSLLIVVRFSNEVYESHEVFVEKCWQKLS